MGIAAEHLGQAELQSIAGQVLTEPKPEGDDIWAHCPWHTESTPGNAFYYTPAKDWAYCHSCGNSGDIIDVYAAVYGLDNREAVKQFMRAYCPQVQTASSRKEHKSYTPRMPGNRSESWKPKEATTPAELWMQHAVKMVTWAQGQLAENSQALEYLAGRGIPADAAHDYGLGLIPQNIWRERRSWGLEPKYRDDGKEKKLWIPAGVTIPYYLDGTLHRVRIRRWQAEPRYYWVPGSGNQTMLLRRRAGTHLPDAAVVVETELDAVALHHAAGDLVHVIALGSSSAKPRTPVFDLLRGCTSVLVAADFDQAGITAWQWWEDTFAQAQLWPSPAGKDVGDAAAAGLPLRDWIVDGLPPAWTIGPSASGGFYKGGGDILESEDRPPETDQAPWSDTAQGESSTPYDCDMPEAVREFRELVSSNPVQIVVADDRLAVRENPAWARDHWDSAKRISDLLYFDSDVAAWVIGHAQHTGGVIHAGNI